MGHFRPEEQCVLFPVVDHIPHHGGGIFGILGIVARGGKGEPAAEIHQIGNELRSHDQRQHHIGASAAAVPGSFDPSAVLRLSFFGLGAPILAIEQACGVEHQEGCIECQKFRIQPGIGAGHNSGGQHRRPDGLPGLELIAHQPGSVCHIEHHKAVQEAEPVGDHVGKMEAVPDIVQLPDDKADIEEQQQRHAAQLVPELHLAGQQVQHCQHNTAHTAVHIGQAFLEIQLHSAGHIARHLAHGIQQALPGVFVRDIQAEGSGKLVDAGLGSLQRGKGRQGQQRGHGNGQGRKERNAEKITEKSLQAGAAADLVADKQQQHKDAGKEADIVVCVDGKKQGQGVKDEFLLPQQCYGAQGHKGQQRKGIQPHEIPLKAQGPGAHAVESAEQGDGNIIFTEGFLKKQGKKGRGQAQLYGHQQRIELQQEGLRHQNAQQVQGGCQIIGDQAQIVHAHAHIPAVKQAVAGKQRPAEGLEERIVLVVHIRIQHGVSAEGLRPGYDHQAEQQKYRDAEGDPQVIPLDFLYLPQVHSVSPW